MESRVTWTDTIGGRIIINININNDLKGLVNMYSVKRTSYCGTLYCSKGAGCDVLNISSDPCRFNPCCTVKGPHGG